MDQDLLNYLDQRFSSIDQRFSSIDQRFQETGQQIQALRDETARQFEKIDQRLDRVGERFDQADRRVDSLETDLRRAYVAIEGLRSEVRLVAADGVVNVTEQLNRHREEVSKKFGEIESLNKLVFRELRSSQKKLAARVTILEATG